MKTKRFQSAIDILEAKQKVYIAMGTKEFLTNPISIKITARIRKLKYRQVMESPSLVR